MPTTIDRHIRVSPEQRKRIESASKSTNPDRHSALDQVRHQGPRPLRMTRSLHEIRLLRSSTFATHVLARELIDSRHEDELEQIRQDISQPSPELPEGSPSQELRGADTTDAADDSSHLFTESLVPLPGAHRWIVATTGSASADRLRPCLVPTTST